MIQDSPRQHRLWQEKKDSLGRQVGRARRWRGGQRKPSELEPPRPAAAAATPRAAAAAALPPLPSPPPPFPPFPTWMSKDKIQVVDVSQSVRQLWLLSLATMIVSALWKCKRPELTVHRKCKRWTSLTQSLGPPAPNEVGVRNLGILYPSMLLEAGR